MPLPAVPYSWMGMMGEDVDKMAGSGSRDRHDAVITSRISEVSLSFPLIDINVIHQKSSSGLQLGFFPCHCSSPAYSYSSWNSSLASFFTAQPKYLTCRKAKEVWRLAFHQCVDFFLHLLLSFDGIMGSDGFFCFFSPSYADTRKSTRGGTLEANMNSMTGYLSRRTFDVLGRSG